MCPCSVQTNKKRYTVPNHNIKLCYVVIYIICCVVQQLSNKLDNIGEVTWLTNDISSPGPDT